MNKPILTQFNQQKTIEIDGIQIRQDQYGRYCLNDLHKASGGNENHQPAFFLRNQQTKDLVVEINRSANYQIAPVESIRGGLEQGTYVVKQLVYAYAMWISASFNLKVINTFDAVVTGNLQPQITTPHDYLSALKALVVSEEQKQIALQERDHAIATKAEIGSRREATAMATASKHKREAEKLKVQLDESLSFASVKAVEIATGRKFNWHPLKKWSLANGLEIQTIPDPNFTEVKTYHKDAWLAVYNINLSSIRGA